MIKAVIFDCFGVLTTDTWRAFIDSLPADVDLEAARDLNRAYDAGLIGLEEFLSKVEEATGHSPKQIENMLDNEIVKNEALLEYIKVLKNNYKVGLLSNIATTWITDSFLNSEEQKLFDVMVFSFQEGMTKPDARIFQLTCERLGVKPTEAIMVDDIDRYCVAAEGIGMKAVVYNDLQQCKRDIDKILSSS